MEGLAGYSPRGLLVGSAAHIGDALSLLVVETQATLVTGHLER